MEMIVKILDKEIQLSDLIAFKCKDYGIIHCKLTFANEYIFSYYYYNEQWNYDYDKRHYFYKHKQYQPTSLQELPDIQQLAKLIEKQVKKNIKITSCIETIDGNCGSVLNKCVLFYSIEKYFKIKYNCSIDKRKIEYLIEESDLYKTKFEENNFSEYTSQFIKINTSKLLKSKHGLGVNTKNFCSVIIK